MRREARKSLARLRRVGLERIRSLDREIARLGGQQQALLDDLRATLDTIRETAALQASSTPRGLRRAGSVSPAGRVRHLHLVGGPRWRVAPETMTLREMERDHIAAVLLSCGWNQSLAAVRLGIGRNTLMRKVKAFGLRRKPC